MPRHSTADTPAATTAEQPTIAYSYVRFSSPEQGKGDSLGRQTELAEAYCKRRGWTLDTSLTRPDLGVSAFRGKNALIGNLRTFLDAVARGTVLPGSVLIVESIDRISRQGIDEGYDMIKGILKKDVRIVTLSPEREFDRDATRSLTRGALEIQLILERAAEESETKSKRVGSAWAKKKEHVRKGEPQRETERMGKDRTILTRQFPAWVGEVGGKLVAIPTRAATVKRIYALAAAGYGSPRIVSVLTREKVPTFGKSPRWAKSYVSKILTDRRTLGEYQPCKGGEPEGDPVPGYFPTVVTEHEWLQAQSGRKQRGKMPGRTSEHVNVFAGLLKNARVADGKDSYIAMTRPDGRRNLVNTAGTEGRTRSWAFPHETFERAVLKCFKEIKPHEILNGDSRPDLAAGALSIELRKVEDKITQLAAELLIGDVPAIAMVLRELNDRRVVLIGEIREAELKASYPLSVVWVEAQSIMEVIDSDPNPPERRLRLRSLLRRMVDSIWLLVVPRGRDRLCAVQIWFADGKKHREYLILHRPPKANASARTEGGHWTRSLAEAVAGSGKYDLRKREHAKMLEDDITALDTRAK